MLDEEARRHRLADNERLIRETNWETNVVATDTGATSDEELELWCACGRSDCAARVLMSLGEYRAVHAYPHRFIVAPGHADDSVEIVIERKPGYDIVEKRPEYQAVHPTSD